MDKKKLGSLVGLVGTCGILTVAGIGYFGQDKANDVRADYAMESAFIDQVDGRNDLLDQEKPSKNPDQAHVDVEVKKAEETEKIEAAEEMVKVSKKADEAKEESLPSVEAVSMKPEVKEEPVKEAPVKEIRTEDKSDSSVNDRKAEEAAKKAAAEKKAAEEKAAKEAAEKKAAEEAAKKEAARKEAENKAAAEKKAAEEKAAKEAAEKKAAEEKAAKEAAEKKAAEEEAAKKEAEKKAAEEANQAPRLYSLRNLMFHGVIRWNGYKFTYYSQRVLPGRGLRIPGRHVNADGFVADKDGYIVLANSAPKGTVIPTPFGYWGKVYDRGTTGNHFDVYTR